MQHMNGKNAEIVGLNEMFFFYLATASSTAYSHEILKYREYGGN